MVNEFERMDCIYVYSCVWMYINAVFLLCTCTRLLCGDTLVHIYCGYIYVGQSKLRAHFISSLHIVAIQKHQNWRSVCNGRATMTASGQHSHRLHADEMKSTCCRLCLHWRHPLCGRQHIETQSRETHRRIHGKATRKHRQDAVRENDMGGERRMQECTHPRMQVQCSYARMQCP